MLGLKIFESDLKEVPQMEEQCERHPLSKDEERRSLFHPYAFQPK